MKRPLLVLLLLLLLLSGVVLFRTFTFKSRQLPRVVADPVELDTESLARRFSEALRLRTVSHEDPGRMDEAEFRRMHDFLQSSFPRVHSELKREVVNGYSLLYTWQGKDSTLAPVVLMGHMDVVPVEDETVWSHNPFGGEIAGGYIWGRGALDDKVNVTSILEAVERLLSEGFQPRRSVLLVFGHDEEIGGNGARAVAALLKERGVRAEMVLDEGNAVVAGVIPGLARRVALIGVAEKGSASIRLTVAGTGGHSSMPPDQTSIGILSKALTRLEESQMPARIDGITKEFFSYIGPEMGFANRLALSNLWLFAPVVKRRLLAAPATAASLRTTTAITMISGGVKENVLPGAATATVNFRVLPGDTVESVHEHVRRAVSDQRVTISVVANSQPSPISPADSEPFRILHKSIAQIFPDAVIAPALVLGATDSRHFTSLSQNVYRFSPLNIDSAQISSIHGVDERIAVENYVDCVRFYRQLLINMVK